MTRKVMSEIFINMNRTVCHRTLRLGHFRGAYAVTLRFDAEPDTGALTALAETLVRDPAVAACEIWSAVDPASQPVSMEEKLRGGDKKIKACLMVDTLRQRDAETLGERLTGQFAGADVGVFRVLCQLGRRGSLSHAIIASDRGKNRGAFDRAPRDHRYCRVARPAA